VQPAEIWQYLLNNRDDFVGSPSAVLQPPH